MSLALLLATELTEDLAAGHEVFGISAAGPYVDRVEKLGVKHVPVDALTRSWNLRSDLRAFFELIGTLRRLRLDVLHTHTPKAGVMGRIAGRLAGVPVVVNTCHGLWARPEDRPTKRVFVYGLEALATRFSDFELFQNAEDSHTMRRVLKKGRWKVVGNGVDLDRFQPDVEGRRRVRAELGVADGEPLVGTIGRRVREKGLAEFAEAAHRLRGKATFIWVGPEDETDAAADVPYMDAIRFVGERTDMPAVYSALDLFVLASYREGFSRASMEAAACGRPMVLTDIRGCREIGDDGVHLLMAPPKDGAALASVVERLLGDPVLQERLGDAARERAAQEFDQRTIAAASLDAYAVVSRERKLGTDRPGGDERVTVLHVIPDDRARGAQVYAGRLRDELADDPEQRHLVVTLFDAPEAAARADVKLAAPSGVFRRIGFSPLAAYRLRRSLGKYRAGVVVAHGGEALKYVVPVAGNVPTAYYRVGLSSVELSRPSRIWLYRTLVARVARVVGVSQAVGDQLQDVLRVPPAKLSVIPNGRDPKIFHLADGEMHGPPRVVFVGQLEPGKRPDLFLDVVAELRGRGREFEAAIIGDGPLMGELAARSATLGVDLMGTRDDVPEQLRSAAILVMTSASDTEGMPGVLIEAGLSGVPVVSTAAAGVADVVVDGVTGYLVVSDEPVELADRVEKLLGDRDVRARVGVSARRRCEETFGLPATAASWRSLVLNMLQRGNA